MTDSESRAAAFAVEEQVARWKGKRLQLLLRSGKELEGTVGEITAGGVELKKLAGREFFDAVVRLEEIAALVYRTAKPDAP